MILHHLDLFVWTVYKIFSQMLVKKWRWIPYGIVSVKNHPTKTYHKVTFCLGFAGILCLENSWTKTYSQNGVGFNGDEFHGKVFVKNHLNSPNPSQVGDLYNGDNYNPDITGKKSSYTWNPKETSIFEGTQPPKQGRNSNKNKCHLGSGYMYIYIYIVFFVHCTLHFSIHLPWNAHFRCVLSCCLENTTNTSHRNKTRFWGCPQCPTKRKIRGLRICWKFDAWKILKTTPENASLEKENNLPNHHFQVLC